MSGDDNCGSLRDLTNDQLKRAISSVEDSGLAKKVCLGVDDSAGEKPRSPDLHGCERDVVVSHCGSSRCGSDEGFGGSQGLTSGRHCESSVLQNSKFSGIDRCTCHEESGAELLKTCSCSFCLTAAFIWSDLHYQDIKGRLSSLKKSRKAASIFVNRYVSGRQAETHKQGNLITSSSQLGTDRACQWRSLFQHMEDSLVHESSQIEQNLLAMKDLRETCKIDLARTTGFP